MSPKDTALSRALVATLVVAAGLALAGCAPGQEGPKDEPPAAKQVSAEEFGRVLSACLIDAGWAAEAGPDGSVSVPNGVPVDQLEKYDADTATCMEAFGPVRALTSEEKMTYFGQLEEVADCLEEKGYAVAEKPSYQSFAETDTGNWDPYGALEGSEQQQATIDCIQPEPIP